MVVAHYLGADAVVVPVTCNDAIDRGPLKDCLEPKTRIGSPYVIAGFARARELDGAASAGGNRTAGFLTGSDFVREGRRLTALATRDAMLPILCVLGAMRAGGGGLGDVLRAVAAAFQQGSLARSLSPSGRTADRGAVEPAR